MVVFKSIRLAALVVFSILIGSCAWVDGSGGAASMRQGVLVAGADHACALVGDGAVKCWGRNNLGQLGGGDIPLSSVAVVVPNVPDATYLAAGTDHTCAVVANGRVYCWGRNSNGQLGAGVRSVSSRPVEVEGIDGAIGVAAGDGHSCAVRSDGAVLCWGVNARGQLGNGSNEPSLAPVRVAGVTTATAIVGGPEHTCALVENGEVRCWGRNDDGQLGNGKTTDSNTPVSVKNILYAEGDANSCFAIGDGSVFCLGLQTRSPGHMRAGGVAALDDLSGGVSLVAFWGAACVNFEDATRLCWWGPATLTDPIAQTSFTSLVQWRTGADQVIGDGPCKIAVNQRLECGMVGRLAGDDGEFVPEKSPNGSVGVGRWKLIAATNAGLDYGCAMTDSSEVLCWGDGRFGKTGGGTSISPSPTIVPGLVDVVSIAASGDHTCVSTVSGEAACWGRLSEFRPPYYSAEVAVAPAPVGEIDSATAVYSTPDFDCAATRSGWLECWPSLPSASLPDILAHSVLIRDIAGVEGIAVDRSTVCFLANGRVECRRSTRSGVWNGAAGFRAALTEVPQPAPVKAIVSASNYTCGLLTTGGITCFANYYHVAASDQPSFGPAMKIIDFESAVSIASNFSSFCAVSVSGNIQCASMEVPEDAVFGAPESVPTISDATAVTAGDGFFCALHRNGTVSCWGRNYDGQLGDGTFDNSDVPVRVNGVEHAEKIVAGDSHTCALLADKTVTCWGDNSYGQRGNGERTLSIAPVWVQGIN